MPTKEADRIEIENVVSPGRVYRVDRAKYEAMRRASFAPRRDRRPA